MHTWSDKHAPAADNIQQATYIFIGKGLEMCSACSQYDSMDLCVMYVQLRVGGFQPPSPLHEALDHAVTGHFSYRARARAQKVHIYFTQSERLMLLMPVGHEGDSIVVLYALQS